MADTLIADTPLREAFKDHLYDVVEACHDIEWVDSGDYGKGDEEESIRACIDAEKQVLSVLVDKGLTVKEELNNAIEEAVKNESNQKEKYDGY